MRGCCCQGLEPVHERPVDIVCKHYKVFSAGGDQLGYFIKRFLLHADRCGIRRVDQEEGFYGRIRQLFYFLI